MVSKRDVFIFDLESNGLLPWQVRPGEKFVDTLHMAGVQNYETREYRSYCDVLPDNRSLDEFIRLFQEAPVLAGHNIIGYDIPLMEYLYGVKPKGKLIDTMLLSQFFYGNIKEIDFANINAGSDFPPRYAGGHGLKAWGYRLRDEKIEFGADQEGDEWETATEEMLIYMKQDVNLSMQVLDFFWENYVKSLDPIELENEFARWMNIQQKLGTYFDEDIGLLLDKTLKEDQANVMQDIQKVFPPRVVSLGEFVPKRNNKTKGYGKGIPCTKIEIEKEFKPTPNKIAERLITDFGWVPTEVSEKTGKPRLDEEIMDSIDIEGIEPVKRYFMLKKRLGMLTEGRNAWLKLVSNNRIHGRVNTLGTVTHRCTHNNPNVSQVTASRKPYGTEMRECFSSPPGYHFIDTDLSGIELRVLAHFLFPYDDGEYRDVILNGDIHTYNQEMAGLPTRDAAKTFIYGTLYGAGPLLIGSMLAPKESESQQKKLGREAQYQFKNKLRGFKKMDRDIKREMSENGGRVKLVDGRSVPVRSEHKKLNVKLQGTAGIYAKKWGIDIYNSMEESFSSLWQPAIHCHDAVSLYAKIGEVPTEEVKKIVKNAVLSADEYFGMNCSNDFGFAVGKDWNAH